MIRNSSISSHEMNNVSHDLISPVDHNLLDFIEARKPKFIFQTNGNAITQEFERDMEGAVKRSYSFIQEFISTESNAASLFTALDGHTQNDRSLAMKTTLENSRENFSGDAQRLNFEPATKAFVSPMAPILPDNCSCAIAADGSTAYISGGLGLREILIVTHTAILQRFVISVRTAGANIDQNTAMHTLHQLLGSTSSYSLDHQIFDPVQVQKGSSYIDAFLTTSDRSSLAL